MVAYDRAVSDTWILQSNPKLYDVDSAMTSRPIIYWRVPQFFEQMKEGDRVLIWRAGKEAGFVGSGILLTAPKHYDLSKDDDPFPKVGFPREPSDWYVPVRVWPAAHVPKHDVSSLLPDHRIVTAPMGTVFRVAADELGALRPLLEARSYDLDRVAGPPTDLLPVLPEPTAESLPKFKDTPTPVVTRAGITPAMFLLLSTPAQPVEVTIEGDSLRVSLVEREALNALDESWDSVGVYLLVGRPVTEGAVLSLYVGKAQGLRSRVRTGHQVKEWTRCLLIQREGLHAFNASDISWLSAA